MERGRKSKSHRPSKNSRLLKAKHALIPKIQIYHHQTVHKVDRFSAISAARLILERYGIFNKGLFIYFVGPEMSSILHRSHFGDPHTTDCMTFPWDNPFAEESVFLGELVICPEAAEEYAKKHGLEYNQELTLYLIHGLLHLMGYLDKGAEKKKIMQREEMHCLKYLIEHDALIKSRS